MGLFVLSEPVIEEKLTGFMIVSSISASVSEVSDSIFILRPATISVNTKGNC